MVFGQRIATLTFEPEEEEPILGLRPGCEKFPVPKDAQDFVLLPEERIVLGRNGTVKNTDGRLELRSLEEWEPIPYAILPFVPPLVVDEAGTRGLAHLPLIDGWEPGMAVIDLDSFKEIVRLPFAGPYQFIPMGADCFRDEESQVSIAPWSEDEVTIALNQPSDTDVDDLDPRALTETGTRPSVVGTGIVATMPHDVADEALIRSQPYAELILNRASRSRRGNSSRSPVIVDYRENVVHRVHRETQGANHVMVPDAESLFVVTEDNVFLRRIDLASAAIVWDLEIGQNRKGTVFTSYATAIADTPLGRLIAVGVYDERVDIVDAETGQRVSQICLHDDGRSRIVSLAWYWGGSMLAIGLVGGTVMFAWVPENIEQAWRLRVFRAADRALRMIRFHPRGEQLFVLSQDGFLRSWELLDDEMARLLTG